MLGKEFLPPWIGDCSVGLEKIVRSILYKTKLKGLECIGINLHCYSFQLNYDPFYFFISS